LAGFAHVLQNTAITVLVVELNNALKPATVTAPFGTEVPVQEEILEQVC
jgi:hypothetical protein